jgi:hypothetical protein
MPRKIPRSIYKLGPTARAKHGLISLARKGVRIEDLTAKQVGRMMPGRHKPRTVGKVLTHFADRGVLMKDESGERTTYTFAPHVGPHTMTQWDKAMLDRLLKGEEVGFEGEFELRPHSA